MLPAHVAGIPIEETVLGMAPVAALLGSAAFWNLRRGIRRRRP
jgi:ribosomal protein S6E (S10)